MHVLHAPAALATVAAAATALARRTPRTPCAVRTVTTSPTFLAQKRKHHPRRSPIWKSPLRPAKVAAYDEALKYIRTDARALRREIAELKTRFQHESARVARAGGRVDDAALAQYREKLWVLEVQSEVNLPEVRYAFATGRCESCVFASRARGDTLQIRSRDPCTDTSPSRNGGTAAPSTSSCVSRSLR